jgi:hypothetical protein
MDARIRRVAPRLIGLLILIALLYSGCGQATLTAEAPQAASTEVVVVTTEVEKVVTAIIPAEGPQATTTLQLWIGDSGSSSPAPKLVDAFMKENPDIQVELEIIPFPDLYAKLMTALAAGDPPDIASVDYNLLYELSGYALPIKDAVKVNPEDFIGDSLKSGYVQDVLLGLPFRRFACSPAYQYLALFKPAAEHEDGVFRLLNYLTQPATQVDAFQTGEWFPVSVSTTQSLNLPCLVIVPERLGESVLNIVSQARELAPKMEGWMGEKLNPEDSNAVIEEGKVQGIGIPLLYNPPVQAKGGEQILVAEHEVAARDVVVGALIVENAPEYPAGIYQLVCVMDGDPTCTLIDESGNVIPVVPEVFETTPAEIDKPVVMVERGSFRKCYYLDGLKVCIRVG